MADLVRELLSTPSAVLVDASPARHHHGRELHGEAEQPEEPGPGGDLLLIRSDLSGTMQLYELAGGDLRQLTDLAESIGSALYVPGGRHVVLEMDQGGDERHQLYRLDVERAGPAGRDGMRALTADPRFGHHLAGVSPDGARIAYVSNRGNGVDFDLWLCELADGSHRLLHAAGTWCQPGSGFSPDGRWVSVLRPGPRPLDIDLLLVDVGSGEVRSLLAHPDEAAVIGSPSWAPDGTFYAASNVGSDLAGVVRVEPGNAEVTPVTSGDWDVRPADTDDDGALLVVESTGGTDEVRLIHPTGATEPVRVTLPEAGVVAGRLFPPPRFSPDGRRVYLTLSSVRRAADVWSFDRHTGRTQPLTSSPAPVSPDELVPAEWATVESFDGERVPLLVLRPPGAEERSPVVVFIHGGPESQSQAMFNPLWQALALTGYAVVVPNVRGSTGYGKRYASLDDTTRRLDSVRDLAAVHRWIGDAGLDADRVALWGGSYGGYMVLAGLAFQPELWAAGVDIVGISDLITFLEHTSDYRRAKRELEYGSLVTDREFLASASPLRHADAIRAPLFMIHGRNDPRVPVEETQQLADQLRARESRCELVIYEDEGHGLARLRNRLDAYPRAISFLDSVLRS